MFHTEYIRYPAILTKEGFLQISESFARIQKSLRFGKVQQMFPLESSFQHFTWSLKDIQTHS
jgi:hypothetical protein